MDDEVVKRAEQLLRVLPLDPVAVALGLDVLRQSEPNVHVGLARGDDDPRLRLSVIGAEVQAGELAVRVRVDREPLDGIEQLDEQVRCAPVRAPLTDRVAEKRAVVEPRQARLRFVASGVGGGDDGADPVLGTFAVALRLVAQTVDQRAAAVEAVDARGPDAGKVHRMDLIVSRPGSHSWSGWD